MEENKEIRGGRIFSGRMKYYLSLVVTLVAVAGLLVAFQPPNFSHRISFKNDSGDVIALARIALPQETFYSSESFTGKWVLESWKDEFPKYGTSAEDYRATRTDDSLWVNLNPTWADNNVVLIGKQTGTSYQGEWRYQTYGGFKAIGTFETVPIPTPNTETR